MVRDSYMSVVGWQKQSFDMSDGDETYQDYCMLPPGEETPVAGICNRRSRGRCQVWQGVIISSRHAPRPAPGCPWRPPAHYGLSGRARIAHPSRQRRQERRSGDALADAARQLGVSTSGIAKAVSRAERPEVH